MTRPHLDNVSVDTVQRGLNELRDYRLIDWKQQGLNRPNIYYILPLSECCYLHPDTNLSGTPQICGIQKPHNCAVLTPQKRGTKNTKTKNTQVKYISRNSKTKKRTDEVNGTYSHIEPGTIRNGNSNHDLTRQHRTYADNQPNSNQTYGNAEPPNFETPADKGNGRRKQASGFTPLAEIIPGEHWHKLQAQNDSKGINVIPYLSSYIEQYTRELGDDPEKLSSNISRAIGIYDEWGGRDVTQFASKMRESKETAANKKGIRARNKNGDPNRMLYFFTCLRISLGLPSKTY